MSRRLSVTKSRFGSKLLLLYLILTAISAAVIGFTTSFSEKRRIEDQVDVHLAETSDRICNQLNDSLSTMDAAIEYILSSPSMLSDIRTLSLASRHSIDPDYLSKAKSELSTGMHANYLGQYTYRTIYYNRDGILYSSFNSANSTVVSSFDPDDIDYLDEADDAKGRNILIAPHTDQWGHSQNPQVFSMVKGIRGGNMGYIEVENLTSDLSELHSDAADYEIIVYMNDEDILYQSDTSIDTALYRDIVSGKTNLVSKQDFGNGKEIISLSVSDEYPISVLVIEKSSIALALEKWINPYPFITTGIYLAVSLLVMRLFMSDVLKSVSQIQNLMEQTTLNNLSDSGNDVRTYDPGSDELRAFTNSYKAMMARLDESIRNERAADLLRLQAQFDTLQAQVNPHFLYNVLNTISARGVEDDDDLVCDYCDSLANILRYSTDNKMRYASVNDEINNLNNYFKLIKGRWGDRFQAGIAVDKAISEMLLPKMTLQQIAENAIIHGFGSSSGPIRLDIVGSTGSDERGSYWMIVVRDNGEGFSQETIDKLTNEIENLKVNLLRMGTGLEEQIGGMGITNTFARLYLLYSKKLIFRVGNNESPGHGAEVLIQIYE
ncbi:MAG: histidine kinase [Lachnospiraceae bacterium]|nr:histidine kinase [Lachnospiraceae bacterium]